MSQTKRITRSLLLALVAISTGCGEDATGPDEACLSVVTLEPPAGSPLAALDRLEVVAVTPEGCARLEGPMAAFNWFSFQDLDSYREYSNEMVTRILPGRGTPTLARGDHRVTIEAPPGAPATGGAYVHQALRMPLYPSASEFMDMISSPEFQAVFPLQQAGARQRDYVFGFQECLVGCERGATITASDDAPLLLHVFRFEGADLGAAIRRLASDRNAPKLAYGGRLIARVQTILGGRNLNSQSGPWGQGTILFRVDSEADARAWVESATFRAFRENTAEDVLVVLGTPSTTG